MYKNLKPTVSRPEVTYVMQTKESIIMKIIYLFLTACLGDDSCGKRACNIVGWKDTKRPPNRDNKSARMSSASSWTETSSC